VEKYKNKKLSHKERAKDLLSYMTLKEKVGQIAQPFKMFDEYTIENNEVVLSNDFKNFVKEYGGIGTVFSFFRADPWSQRTFDNGITLAMREKAYNTMQRFIVENSRLGIPALFEENAPHGLQVLDSVIYPTNLGVGATFDSDLSYEMARCIAKECKTFGIHVPNSSLFDMACDPRFGRTEECLSEDPYLSSKLCGNIVKGYKDSQTMICCKHYCAQGAACGGHCGGVTNIGDRELHEIHLPSVCEAVKHGADFIMVSYNDVDGIRCHANRHILRDVLQSEIGFDGVIRADRTGNDFGGNLVLSGAKALNAGVMLGLGDKAFTYLEEALEKGYTTIEKIDEAVLHILTKKFESGIMDEPYILEENQSLEYVKSGISQKTAYTVAAESLVLLKNHNSVLPFKGFPKIALFGEHADSIYTLLGDYTPPQNIKSMQTIFDVMKEVNPNTKYTKGWDFFNDDKDFENALNIAENADVVVMCLGGSSARDFSGVYNDKGQTVEVKSHFMDCGEGRDVCDLTLPGNQIKLLKKLKELGKTIVSIVIQGRTYLMNEVVSNSDAVVIAWYPGQEGPRAIVDTLFGKNNSFGRLPISIPNSSSALPVYYNRRPMPDGYTDLDRLSDYPFGSGISYSEIVYENLIVEENYTVEEIENGAKVKLSVDVINNSEIDVNEVSMLFIHAKGSDIVRRIKELKGFQRVHLAPNQRKKISFYLAKNELEIYGADNKYIVEPTCLEILVGGNVEKLLYTSFDIKSSLR